MGKVSMTYGSATDGSGKGLPVTVEKRMRSKGGFEPESLDSVIDTLVHNARSGAELLQEYTPMLAGTMSQLRELLGNELERLQLSVALARAPKDRTPEEAQAAVDVQREAMATVMDASNRVSIMLDRLNKMTMQAVKAKDEAVRLRAFLAGDEDRGSLDGLSEVQLRKLVTDAASGWTRPEEPSDG